MNIEEAINCYLELKPCKEWIESIDKDFFFKFTETMITAYEEEKGENKRLRKCHLQYEEMTGIDLLLPSKEE